MQFINEEIIEKVIEGYEKDENKFYTDQELLANEQPAIDGLFTDESLDLLNDDEYELMWFLATVIYQCAKETMDEVPVIDPMLVEAADERNWEILGEKQGPFHDKITPFFDGYDQEDLLAFVEDSLEVEEDEDVNITSTGRELIFICCKTMIDVLHEIA